MAIPSDHFIQLKGRLKELAEKDHEAATHSCIPEYVFIDREVFPYSINRHIVDQRFSITALESTTQTRACIGSLLKRLEDNLSTMNTAVQPLENPDSTLTEAAHNLLDRLHDIHADSSIVETHLINNGSLGLPSEPVTVLGGGTRMDMPAILKTIYSELASLLADTHSLLEHPELRNPHSKSNELLLKTACEALQQELLGPTATDIRRLYILAMDEKMQAESWQMEAQPRQA